MSDRLIIYHANCWDGLAAAWAVKKNAYWEHAEMVAAHYGDEPPSTVGRHVAVVDFSYPREVIESMHDGAASIEVIDHHKTAEEALSGLDYCHFDSTKSGCVLAWERFNPERPVPEILRYVQDRDLWLHEQPRCHEIIAALRSYPMEFETLDDFMWRIVDDHRFWGAVAEGESILRAYAQIVDAAVEHAVEVRVGGIEGRAVNCTTNGLFSEVAGELADGADFGAAWFVRSDGQVQWSLRSREGGADVSELAKAYGGGGHRGAAGFEVPLAEHAQMIGMPIAG